MKKNDFAGGLSASFIDAQGFTWDIGGHVLFSHCDYYDRLMQGVKQLKTYCLEHRN